MALCPTCLYAMSELHIILNPCLFLADTPESIMMNKMFDLVRKVTNAHDTSKEKKSSAGQGSKAISSGKSTPKISPPLPRRKA